MKSPFITIVILFISSLFIFGQSSEELKENERPIRYYLPDIQYNELIPSPKSFLGYQIGEWHVSHDQLKFYMKLLAEKSSRVLLEEYARSHEDRPLQLLTISTPENLDKIEEIRKEHLSLSDPKSSIQSDFENMPVVIYQGYSVHGNESSGSNAAMLIAYYLAAGESDHIDSLLKNTVILLDPCYNPDGLQRFASWVNRFKSAHLNSDPYDMEFREAWPGGRTNHYWFDLNRDWILLTHPESEGRIYNFHRWKPNVLTDHHEMGTNSSFFFQPGVPQRTNPNTPGENQHLTEKIAHFHVRALDEIGSLYYSKENFDDFYYGKGSTYPDINGGIGILFEQASSRGHLQESQNGLLSFPFTIKNQVVTSLSTQNAALSLRKELLQYQRTFYTEALDMANKSEIKAYHIHCNKDLFRLDRFAHILHQHQIEVFIDTLDTTLYIPINQKQYRLLKSLMERVTSFKDSVFYDVSAWTFPDAFNLNVIEIKRANFKLPKTCVVYHTKGLPGGQLHGGKANYAYLFEWKDYNAAQALQMLFDKGLQAKISHSILQFKVGDKELDFAKGSIVIPVNHQPIHSDKMFMLMENIGERCKLDIYALNSGYSENGISLGSPQIKPLNNKKTAMLVGNGTNPYDAGEIWHHFDLHLSKPLTKLDKQYLHRVNLAKYDVILVPDGSYAAVESDAIEKLKIWVRNGGTLICFKSAIAWAQQQDLSKSTFKPVSKGSEEKVHSYETRSEDRTIQLVGGAIVQINLDLSHPLSYGYSDPTLAVFHKGSRFLEQPKNVYAAPIKYSKNGLISGYMSKQNIQGMSETPGVLLHSYGKGRVICFSFNPLFRGYFYGSNKIFDNAVFFGDLIDAASTE